jgi:hypothetical protein
MIGRCIGARRRRQADERGARARVFFLLLNFANVNSFLSKHHPTQIPFGDVNAERAYVSVNPVLRSHLPFKTQLCHRTDFVNKSIKRAAASARKIDVPSHIHSQQISFLLYFSQYATYKPINQYPLI